MKTALAGLGKVTLSALFSGWLVIASAVTVRAGLGADVNSTESDALAMQARMLSQASTSALEQSAFYTVKTFVTPNGVTVREYAAPSGIVFGVAWQGRRPPDLSVLLGSYYSEYTTASARKRHKNLHHEVIEGPNAVVLLGGHMGHVVGHAYVPGLVPSGLDPKVVVK